MKNDLYFGDKDYLLPIQFPDIKGGERHEMVVVVTITRTACDRNNRWCLLALGILVGGI
jgi:hypothetical protein